jgi:hypothetical protein
MSLDIFLQRFSAGKEAEVQREPVLTVLQTTKFSGPDDFGFYIITFPDGVDVEFSAKGLEQSESFTGCTFIIRGMGTHLIKFIFDIAVAGDMAILPAMENVRVILTAEHQERELPQDLHEDWLPPILCGSANELELLLIDGHSCWQVYREQVAGKLSENRDD